MRRREFIKKSSAVGLTGLLGQGCSSNFEKSRSAHGPGFDIHPFINAHPEAVFIVETSVESKYDYESLHKEGLKFASEIIVKSDTTGYPNSTLVTVKNNWHGIQKGDLMAENTDPHFIEGWVMGMMEKGPRKFFTGDANDLNRLFTKLDFAALAERNGVNLEYYNKDYWELKKDQIKYLKIPNGVVFDTMGHIPPFGNPDTFLVNVAKLKAHSMGITTTVKSLQGLCPGMFRRFCTPYKNVRSRGDKKYARFLKKNFERDIEKLYAKHVKQGIPRWDKPSGGAGYTGGIWQEQWVQRMLDSYSVSPSGLHIVEGIYAMDGNGFGAGPHEKSPEGYTSRDYMSNVIIFGLDPFRVDIISHWMAGHEPGNFGLFHIAIERGFSDVLDPHDIPVYFWKDGRAELTGLEKLPRSPLKTLYLQRDYNGQNEPTYHLCDEPFDYSAWKKGVRVGECTPSVIEFDRDAGGDITTKLSKPERGHVYVDILDRNGTKIGQLLADGELEPGRHQVVWDGFNAPGLYNVYSKGMNWDAEKKIVTYS
ncbi:MAG: DUF362 domain-containing protein [Candidatus Latescibacteria bacterium]|jgi:uncharacterized protein (DUF362 family)|nr:DUF362 domain-containing protein [Candidatus Latescibacterota bacterium]